MNTSSLSPISSRERQLQIEEDQSLISESATDVRIEQYVTRSIFGDLAKGVAKSKIFRAVLFSGVAVGTLFLTFHLLALSAPPIWMISAVAGGGFTVALLAQLPFFKGWQKTQFEISAISRLFKHNYHEIGTYQNQKIYLGALPNRLRSEGERLVNHERIGAILSVNESWERFPNGLSLPYSRADWENLRVEYHELNVNDHTLLGDDALNEAAEFIHGQLEAGKNVYVHCRAGCGRSAMSIAAYLIRYESTNAEQACQHIKDQRPVSTIMNKLSRLERYEQSLVESNENSAQ